jgi:hypothetical protein
MQELEIKRIRHSGARHRDGALRRAMGRTRNPAALPGFWIPGSRIQVGYCRL